MRSHEEKRTFRSSTGGGNAAEVRSLCRKQTRYSAQPKKVPKELRHLIPWAEKFGIGDDLIRADFFATTPEKEIAELKKLMSQHDDLLDHWLAGPEADGPKFSKEYLAFSNMRMGADDC